MKPKAAHDDTAIGLPLVKQGVVLGGRDVRARVNPSSPPEPRKLTHDGFVFLPALCRRGLRCGR